MRLRGIGVGVIARAKEGRGRMKDLTTDWTSDGMGTGDGMMGSSAVTNRHRYHGRL